MTERAEPVWPLLVMAILPLFAAACGGGGDVRPDSTEDLGAPTVNLEAPTVALPEDEVRRGLAEVLTLVDADGLPARFHRVIQARMTDSTAYVLASQEERLTAFSLGDGKEIGPLETSSTETKIDAISVLRQGGAVGWDRNHKEFWVFGRDGSPAGPMKAPVKGNPGSIIEAVDSVVWIWSTVSGDYRTEALERTVWKYSLDGTLLGSVDLPPSVRHDPGFALVTASGGLQNFPRTNEVTWSPAHGLLRGENSSYSFLVERGDTSLAVAVDYAPAALTETEAQWWRGKAAQFTASSRGMTYSVPNVKPAYRSLRWDDSGRIWVWRYVEGRDIDSVPAVFPSGSMPLVEPVVLDVFDPDGCYLWTLELPPRSRVLVVKGDRLLMATRIANMGDEEIGRLMRITEQEEPLTPRL